MYPSGVVGAGLQTPALCPFCERAEAHALSGLDSLRARTRGTQLLRGAPPSWSRALRIASMVIVRRSGAHTPQGPCQGLLGESLASLPPHTPQRPASPWHLHREPGLGPHTCCPSLQLSACYCSKQPQHLSVRGKADSHLALLGHASSVTLLPVKPGRSRPAQVTVQAPAWLSGCTPHSIRCGGALKVCFSLQQRLLE